MPMSDRAAYNTLSHWVETTPQFIFDTMFPVETVSNSQQWLVIQGRKRTSNADWKKKWENLEKNNSHPTKGFLFSFAVSCRRPRGVDSWSILSAVGTPCKFTIMQHSHVLHRPFNLTLFPCFNRSTSPSHLLIQPCETNIECGTIH